MGERPCLKVMVFELTAHGDLEQEIVMVFKSYLRTTNMLKDTSKRTLRALLLYPY